MAAGQIDDGKPRMDKTQPAIEVDANIVGPPMTEGFGHSSKHPFRAAFISEIETCDTAHLIFSIEVSLDPGSL